MKRTCRMRWEMHKCRPEGALLHVEDSLFDSSRDDEAAKRGREMIQVFQQMADQADMENPFKAFQSIIPDPLNSNELDFMSSFTAIHGVKSVSIRPYTIRIVRSMVVEWSEIYSRVVQVVADYLNVDVRMLDPINCDCDNPH